MWAWKVRRNWLGTELRVLHRDGVYEQKCEAGKVVGRMKSKSQFVEIGELVQCNRD